MIDFLPYVHDEIPFETMQDVFEKLRTPCKAGVVLHFDDAFADSPSVFFYHDSWYMYYVKILKDTSVSGYETCIAKSPDLLHWTETGRLLTRNDRNHWDSLQCGGYLAYQDIRFGGSNTPEKVNGRYYVSYLGGSLNGYETDPLSMGLACSEHPDGTTPFHRFEEPILTPHDPDTRTFETRTLYKSCLFRDEARMTGHPYVNAYNAKGEDGKERIFLAVSDDGEHWTRYGNEPVINEIREGNGVRITGDPQILKTGNLYIMLYFVLQNGQTFNTFACSRDLIHWTKWTGEPLIRSEYDFENIYAHKSWLLKHQGTVYHFYCAVSDQGERAIALASSAPLT